MKTDSKIELEFNKDTDEITYFNYLNRNIHTSFLLSNVILGIEEIVNNEINKYHVINNFRISARSDVILVNSKIQLFNYMYGATFCGEFNEGHISGNGCFKWPEG